MTVFKLDGQRRRYHTVWLELDDNNAPQIRFTGCDDVDDARRVREVEMDDVLFERFRTYLAEGQYLQDMLHDLWANAAYQHRR